MIDRSTLSEPKSISEGMFLKVRVKSQSPRVLPSPHRHSSTHNSAVLVICNLLECASNDPKP